MSPNFRVLLSVQVKLLGRFFYGKKQSELSLLSSVLQLMRGLRLLHFFLL